VGVLQWLKLGKGARVSGAMVESDGRGASHAGAGLLPEEEGDPDDWAPLINDTERRRCNASGERETGPWAAFWLGPKGCPVAFNPFFLFIPFSVIISFIKFANEHQINSNQNMVFSNIQNNVLK
jgi:hypothetical protein